MSDKLNSFDRNILEFRPSIGFIQPEAEEQRILPIEEPIQLEDIQESRDRIKKLSKAVTTLAAAIQSRADQRASSMVINLDSNVDQDAIQAMRRKFPNANPNRITYAQYRQLKQDIRNKGLSIARQALIQPDDIKKAREDLTNRNFSAGDFNTEKGNTGGLRPELDPNLQIIPPINMEELQINLICILVNFIWKNFIKPAVIAAATASLVGGVVAAIIDAVPDELCDPGSGIDIPGLLILGEQPDDLLSGKTAAKETAEVLTAEVLG